MSQEQEFKVGTIAKLKSGGPDMTVKELRKNMKGEFIGLVICQWFAGKGLQQGEFPVASLEVVKPGTSDGQ